MDGPLRNLRVVDAHTHAFPDSLAPSAVGKLQDGGRWEPVRAHYDGTVAGLVASMDRAGIERAVVVPVATRPEQVPKITRWSASVASERLIPFASIHPACPDVEAEVARAAEAGLLGLKFHPQYMDCAVDDPRVIRIGRAAAEAGLAMLTHAGYDVAFEADERAAPQRVRRLHEAVPDLRLTAAHLGGWQRWEEALEHLAGRPIYLDTSYSLGRCPPEVLGRLIEKHPPEYLLFGTDGPWTDQNEELRKFLDLPLGEEALRLALWENPHRFVGLPA